MWYTIHVLRHRIICLADLDCFFVEVERLHRPELRGLPVIIGGQPGQRGVVAACSYEARALGVHSAMPMGEAYRKVQAAGVAHTTDIDRLSLARGGRNGRRPEPAVFMHSGLHGNYTLYSRRVRDILREAVPGFRSKSIDEFELDISGCEKLFARDYGGIEPFVEHLRRRVKKEVGLPLSVGIGPSRMVAKMASRHAKPDGVFRVLPEQVVGFLGPHHVQAVPGIGPVTAAGLRARGVERVAQLLALPERMLRHTFGLGLVGVLRGLGQGVAAPPREEAEEAAAAFGAAARARPKSIGHETTFARDVLDQNVIKRSLWRLTEDACQRLRAADLRARHVTVKIRYSDFHTVTKGGYLGEPSDSDHAIFTRVLELFAQGRTRRLRLRLVGVRLQRLCAGASQLLLFSTRRRQREEQLLCTVDRIRERYGRDSVYVGPGVERLKEERPVAAQSTAGIQTGFMPDRR